MIEMSEQSINAKHYRIRSTHDLKYPPNESRCRAGCGSAHDPVPTERGERLLQHRCFLAVAHEGECEFSSACERGLSEQVEVVAA